MSPRARKKSQRAQRYPSLALEADAGAGGVIADCISNRRATGLESRHFFVSRRTIDRRNGHIDQAEIDRQLTAMMDEVIDGRSHHGQAFLRENHTIAVAQRPLLFVV